MLEEPNQILTQSIIRYAEMDPTRLALVFVGEDGSEEAILAARFHVEASRYALALQTIGVQEDDLVILVLQHSQTLLYAFWGAMYLGSIASIFPFLTESSTL